MNSAMGGRKKRDVKLNEYRTKMKRMVNKRERTGRKEEGKEA